jgi:hypothetical protein
VSQPIEKEIPEELNFLSACSLQLHEPAVLDDVGLRKIEREMVHRYSGDKVAILPSNSFNTIDAV